MNKLKLLLLGTIFYLCDASPSQGQVRTKVFEKEIPLQLLPINKPIRKTYNIEAPSEFTKFKKEAKTNGDVGNRFALPTEVAIDVMEEAALCDNNGATFFCMTLKADSAFNISLQFKEFFLSKNSVLSIFTVNELTDSITAEVNNANKVWTSRTYQGDKVNLVLRIPKNEIHETKLRIGKVLLGFRSFGITPLFGNPGASDSCMRNVSCPEGTGWEKERNAVALINANGHWGTGTLVMNSCGTNTPYLLTAQHGLDGEEQTWAFEFLFFSNECNSNVGYREDLIFSGATVKSSYPISDFALLQLNHTPASNSGLYYAGWNRNYSFFFPGITMLHHPKGDVMKISKDDDFPQGVTWAGKEVWKLTWDLGGAQHGSSGGAFFDKSHRIIGQMFGVETSHLNEPCYPDAYGGRLGVSWEGGGTPNSRLKDWLDPSNSGAITTNTTSVENLFPNPNFGSTLPLIGDNVVCGNSATYSITGLLPGATVTSWELYPPEANGQLLELQNICTIDANGSQATLTKVNNGTAKLVATIMNCSGVVQFAQKTITFGVPEIYNYGKYSPYTINGPFEPLTGTVNFTTSVTNYVTLESSGNNLYSWEYFNGSTINSYYSLSYPQNNPTLATIGWNAPVYPYDFIGFNIHTTNTCGTRSDPLYFYYNGYFAYYQISPNPANSSVSISHRIEHKNSFLEGVDKTNFDIKKVQIINKLGIVVMEKSYPGNSRSASINVTGLKADIYTLRIFSKDNIESHQIRIQH